MCAQQRLIRRVRTSLFAAILSQPLSFFDTSSTGALLSRLTNDCGVLANDLTWIFRWSVRRSLLNNKTYTDESVSHACLRCCVAGGVGCAHRRHLRVPVCRLPPAGRARVVPRPRHRRRQPHLRPPPGRRLGRAAGGAGGGGVGRGGRAGCGTFRLFRVALLLCRALSQADALPLSQVRTVASCGAQALELSRYGAWCGRAYDAGLTQGWLDGVYYSAISSLAQGCLLQGALLAYGALLVQRNQLAGPALIATLLYQSQLQEQFGNVLNSISNLYKTCGATAHVFALLDGATPEAAAQRQPPPRGNADACSPTPSPGDARDTSVPCCDVAFEDVHFAYPSRPLATVLRGVTLFAAKGSTLALVGPSGACVFYLSAPPPRHIATSLRRLTHRCRAFAAASRRCSTCCAGSTPQHPALCASTGATCAPPPRRGCGRASPSWRRSRRVEAT